MAITYTTALQGHRTEDSRPSGLMRVLSFLRGRVAAAPRDDRVLSGPGFAQLVPDLATEIIHRSH